MPTFDSWAFQCSSVKPRLYDQSCMRLCIANRFVTAAPMSWLEPGTNGVKHLLANHAFVQGETYSRSRLTGRYPVAPGVSGVVHASPEIALFPTVVKVGALVRKL